MIHNPANIHNEGSIPEKLYHGSSKKFSVIKAHQAKAGDGLIVPKEELLNAVYLTSDKGFATAIAAMPDGAAHIDHQARTITFEHPHLFDPEKEVYLYEVDGKHLSATDVLKVDEYQYAVQHVTEVVPTTVQVMKAKELLNYYSILHWQPKDEIGAGA